MFAFVGFNSFVYKYRGIVTAVTMHVWLLAIRIDTDVSQVKGDRKNIRNESRVAHMHFTLFFRTYFLDGQIDAL